MKKEKTNRTRWLHLRLSEHEYNKLQKGFSSSTKRKLSEYVRDILLDKPVTVFIRDKSMDEAMYLLEGIRKELNAVGINFNQLVKKLNGTGDNKEQLLLGKETAGYYRQFDQQFQELDRQVRQIFKKWLQE